MPKIQQHTVADSFSRGVERGRKEARDGDYHDAVIGLVFMLVIFIFSGWAFVKLLRWLIHW